MIKSIFIATSLLSMVVAEVDEMPRNAKAGECFTKAFYPPKYTKVTKIKSTKKVKLSDTSVKYDVIPAQYSWREERVKVSDGTEKIVTTPAVYKTVYEQVLVEPAHKSWRRDLTSTAPKAFNSCVDSASKVLAAEASEQIVVTPAKYRTTNRKIMTDSTSVKLLPSVAVYKKVKDKVAIEPARTEWRKSICQNRGCNQSEVLCLTEVPTVYKQVTKKIVLQPAVAKKVTVTPIYKTVAVQELVEPATAKTVVTPPQYQAITKKEKVEDAHYYWSDASSQNAQTRLTSQCNKICLTSTPAKYKRIAKRIVVTPAGSKKIKTPAKFVNIKVKKIVKDAAFKKTIIPAEYITVLTYRERTKGHAKWMPMICESNMTSKIIGQIQEALKAEGFYTGPVDGVWNIASKSAARAYQREKGLTVTHKLSIETMMSLGIY